MKVTHSSVLLIVSVVLCYFANGVNAIYGKILSDLLGTVACSLCKPVLAAWIKTVRLGVPISVTTDKLVNFSHLIGDRVSPEIVSGFLERWKDQLEYILKHSSLSAGDACASLINNCGSRDSQLYKWKVPLPPRLRNPPPVQSVRPARLLKVLQIADIHYEPEYTTHSNTRCSNNLYCCRAKDGILRPGHKDSAGYWGSYINCDTAPSLFDSMLRHIRLQHPDIDYIMWTGDNAPHDLHESSRARVLHINKRLSQQVFQNLPSVMTLTAIGNHDSHPVNSFPPLGVPPAFSNDWLMRSLHEMWSPLLRTPPKPWPPIGINHLDREERRALNTGRFTPVVDSFDETFPLHGYYYAVVEEWNIRYLVLNTNVCYRWNFWSLLEVSDPGGQLHWLVRQLSTAELLGQSVHILGHLSPADPDCRFDWSHQYHRIVLRFHRTIAAQFFSHTHLDEFQVALDKRGRARSVTYISPSVSSWTNVNPGYKIYHVEAGSGAIVDTEHWSVNLGAANRRWLLSPSEELDPGWYVLSSARHIYNMPNLRPKSWLRVAKRMANSRRYFDRVYANYWGNSSRRDDCNAECRKRLLCNIVGTDRSSNRHCDRIENLIS